MWSVLSCVKFKCEVLSPNAFAEYYCPINRISTLDAIFETSVWNFANHTMFS